MKNEKTENFPYDMVQSISPSSCNCDFRFYIHCICLLEITMDEKVIVKDYLLNFDFILFLTQ